MDCTDIFDLSSEELLEELSSGSHHSDGESLGWRHRLILQELQERQGFEDLAFQLLPSPPLLPPAKTLPPAVTTLQLALPLSQLPSNNTSLSTTKLETLSDPEPHATIPEAVVSLARNNEQKESTFSAPKLPSARQGTAAFPLRDAATAPVRKIIQAAPKSEGSKTARASILTEIVIGASPVMSSPRRRSSFRKKADEETPRKGRPEKGEGSKENTEKRREVARSVGLRAIGAAGKGREKKEVEDRMGHQKGVESSGKESDQGATTRSVATGGKVKGDDASESKLTDLRVGSKSGKEHEMLGKGGQEGSVGVESVETSESAAVPYEALPGIGDLGVGPSDIDKCQSAVCAGTVPDCPEGSLVSPVLKVEAVDEADSPSPVNGDPSDSCKVAGFSSAETPFRKGTSAVRSETSGGCRASEEDLSEEPSVGDKLPERSEREAVEYSSASAPQETSFESHPPIIEPSSKSLEIQLDRALSTRESSSELEPSESTRDGQNGISEIDKHNEGDVAERSDSKPSSPNLAGPTGLAGQSLDRSSGISRTEPASSAIDSLTLIPSVSSQTELGPLIRFEQIFTRFAPGTVLSKEETARPGPALQQFFKDVAQCLDADAQLVADLPGGPELRTSDALLLRVDAGDHSEVEDLLTSCARASGAWVVDADARSTTWNVLWTWAARPRVDYSELLTWQRVNHFPNSKQLTRKDLLKGHLARFSRAANALMPTTFTLPREYVAFVRAFSDGRTDVRDPSETLAGASASASNVSEASGKVVRAGNSTADISDASGHQVAAASWSSGDVSEASGRQGSASGVNADGETGGEESRCAEETTQTASSECSNVWIMKPVGRSRGEGIFLVSDICHVAYGEAMVVQKYVERPLLLHGHKFDLRLYVLVTSFNPLEAFLYQEGFARFASRPYSLSESSLTDLLVHLTNTEVQKQRDHVPAFFLRQSEGDTSRHQPPENSQRGESSGDGGRGEDAIEDRNFDIAGRLGRAKVNGVDGCQRSNGDGATLAVNTETAVPIIREDRSHPVKSSSLDSKVSCASDSNSSRRSEAAHAFESEVQAENSGGFENLYGGCKVSLIRAFALMVSHGVNVDRLWRRITALVLQSLEAVQTAIPANKNCFELFGYDVLVDETHQPWLVEVNSSPSMETGTPLDCALKGALIRDTLALVDPLPFDRPSLASILRRRATPLPSVKTFGAKTDRPLRHDPALHDDLDKILNGRRQRRLGDVPGRLGDYQRIAPSNPHKKQAPKGRVSKDAAEIENC